MMTTDLEKQQISSRPNNGVGGLLLSPCKVQIYSIGVFWGVGSGESVILGA